MKYNLIILLSILLFPIQETDVALPIDVIDRNSMEGLILTKIGEFGLLRKSRPAVPVHYHTGIDIKRIGAGYDNSAIYPIADGIIISSRDDGPYAQLIIEHDHDTFLYWSVYEHIAGIKLDVDQRVTKQDQIARFMNRKELDLHGWQFNHFHLEILRIMPKMIPITSSLPQRRFKSYTLKCYSQDQLKEYFFDPIEFLKTRLEE